MGIGTERVDQGDVVTIGAITADQADVECICTAEGQCALHGLLNPWRLVSKPPATQSREKHHVRAVFLRVHDRGEAS
jgi:hypothetical protein